MPADLLTLDFSGALYEGPVGFHFPLLFSGEATLNESYDDDAGVYRVALEVRNRLFGFLFGYEGEFQCEFIPAHDAPDGLKPVRHERRIWHFPDRGRQPLHPESQHIPKGTSD